MDLVIPFSKAQEQTMQGDEFAELALPLFDSLYNFACWLAQDRAEAEDLVQEAYAKALKGFSSFQAGTNFRAWIFRILRNTFLNSRTGLAASQTVALEDEEALENVPAAVTRETPESILFERMNQEAIQGAIENLALPFREVLLLADVEEMPYREIAETLAIPIGTVMSRLARARRVLRG
ncbi:MAG TPA: sigma-70 family RNA polymerase sigma factor, partial [Candidatus Acidoferrales bacterium]|nr:sigma-70 family RNA polymerase sigma factor [Candidatus Acidoferrales bacterium]